MSTSHSVEQEALAGRLPVLSGNRVYKTYGSFLWTCCAFSAATWAFLIGSYLPYVGDWRLGVMGYVIGLIIGMALVSLASGVPSYKYGTDPIDTAKASFGYRGIIVPLFGLLATLIGWSYVVEALTARGAANVAATVTGSQVTGDSHEHLVIGVALATLFLVWFIACKGPKFFERLNGFIGPLHMLITLVMFGILVHKFGLENLWHNQVAPDQMLSHDPVQGLALAVEFGVSNAMTWWPVMGGLTRLVKAKSCDGPINHWCGYPRSGGCLHRCSPCSHQRRHLRPNDLDDRSWRASIRLNRDDHRSDGKRCHDGCDDLPGGGFNSAGQILREIKMGTASRTPPAAWGVLRL